MLPSPAQLRERSRFYLKAAREATEPATKHRRINCAFVLAQVAQVIERDKQGANANAVRLAQMVFEVLAAAHSGPSDVPRADANADKEPAISGERARIRAWRVRAEELRTTADSFAVSSARESLQRAAANYDQLANDAEAMLEGTPSGPGEKAG
jgi:hypothetical protein